MFDFTDDVPGPDYEKYLFTLGPLILVRENLLIRVSANGGTTFAADETDYVFKPKSGGPNV